MLYVVYSEKLKILSFLPSSDMQDIELLGKTGFGVVLSEFS
jgi:hypothetical protein